MSDVRDPSVTTWLSVRPMDTIMVRDGRRFDAGAGAVATGTPPPPSTLGGVVHKAVGGPVRRIVGSVVETRTHGVVFPAPADLACDEDVVCRLSVRPKTADEQSDLDERFDTEHRLSGRGDSHPGWITRDGLSAWLHSTSAVQPGQDLRADWCAGHLTTDQPWEVEQRIGLARQRGGAHADTAEPGMLYSMTQLRPHEGTRFLIGCENPDAVTVTDDLVPLGGRGRLAEVRVDEDGRDPRPAAPDDFPEGRLTVYLATPALLADPLWHPPSATLRAVAMGGPHPIAAASVRYRSSHLLWAVPAGTVFFLDFGSSAAAEAWSVDHHGSLLAHQRELPVRAGQPQLVTAGFGSCLTGRW
jgi:CRISPR-associated protein Cmr3